MENLTFEQLPNAVMMLIKEVSELKALLTNKQEQPIAEPEKFLTIQEAATLLHLTVQTMYGKVSRNEIKFVKRGKRLYFSSVELLNYLKGGTKNVNANLAENAGDYLKRKGGKSND